MKRKELRTYEGKSVPAGPWRATAQVGVRNSVTETFVGLGVPFYKMPKCHLKGMA